MNGLTWWEASVLAMAGRQVRRAIWRDRWITFAHALYFLTPVNAVTLVPGLPRVVREGDWSGAEFAAHDWTDEPIPPISDRPIAFPPLGLLIVRYRWGEPDGADLDTRTALLGTGDGAVDGVDLGYARASAVPASPPYDIQWGGDNTSEAGVEAIAVDFAQLMADYPGSAEFRVRLRAHWFSARRSGDVELELEAFSGGAVVPAGVNDLACDGEQILLAATIVNSVTVLPAASDDGDDLGVLVYDAMTRTAVLEAS